MIYVKFDYLRKLILKTYIWKPTRLIIGCSLLAIAVISVTSCKSKLRINTYAFEATKLIRGGPPGTWSEITFPRISIRTSKERSTIAALFTAEYKKAFYFPPSKQNLPPAKRGIPLRIRIKVDDNIMVPGAFMWEVNKKDANYGTCRLTVFLGDIPPGLHTINAEWRYKESDDILIQVPHLRNCTLTVWESSSLESRILKKRNPQQVK